MKVSFWVILLALLVSSVPFLSFPDALDRAVIAVGGVLIVLLEGARVYSSARRSLGQKEDHTDGKRATHSDTKNRKKPRFRRWLSLRKGRTNKNEHDAGDHEDFNVYQL